MKGRGEISQTKKIFNLTYKKTYYLNLKLYNYKDVYNSCFYVNFFDRFGVEHFDLEIQRFLHVIQ